MIATREKFSWLVGNAILSIDSGKDKTKPNRALFRAHHSFQREISLSCFGRMTLHIIEHETHTLKPHQAFYHVFDTNNTY